MNGITFPTSVLALALVALTPSVATAQNFNSSANVEFKASRDRDDSRNHRRYGHRYQRDGGRDWRRHDHRADRRDRDDRHGKKSGKDFYSGPSGTYVGGFSAYYDRGNGTYFYIDRDGAYSPAPSLGIVRPGPGAKLVDPRSAGNPCSMEAGVCIIRPGD
jgi:hypothetical protein